MEGGAGQGAPWRRGAEQQRFAHARAQARARQQRPQRLRLGWARAERDRACVELRGGAWGKRGGGDRERPPGGVREEGEGAMGGGGIMGRGPGIMGRGLG